VEQSTGTKNYAERKRDNSSRNSPGRRSVAPAVVLPNARRTIGSGSLDSMRSRTRPQKPPPCEAQLHSSRASPSATW
jgi:hypothetical protein